MMSWHKKGGPEHWIGKVVNRKGDPTMAGKVQVRCFGLHDDTINIPDADLPWAYNPTSTSSASKGGVGNSPVGLIEGTIVYGIFLDQDRMIPLVQGSLPASSFSQTSNTPTNDIFGNAQGTDHNPVTSQSVVQAVGQSMLSGHLPTTGNVPFSGQGIAAVLQQVDPNNSSGVVKGAISFLTSLANLHASNTLTGLLNAGHSVESLVTNALLAELSGTPLSLQQSQAKKLCGLSYTSLLGSIKSMTASLGAASPVVNIFLAQAVGPLVQTSTAGLNATLSPAAALSTLTSTIQDLI